MDYQTVKYLGRLIQGNVFDCNKKFLEQKLRDLDERLYLKWNSEKVSGRGCWEVRIKPSKYTIVPYGEYKGHEICKLELIESDLVHHILDVPYLTIRIIDKLKSIDTYQHVNSSRDWVDHLEDLEDSAERKAEKVIKEELRLRLKDERKYLKVLYEEARSGVNPAEFFGGKYK